MLLDNSELLGPLVDCVDVSAAPSDSGHLKVSTDHLPVCKTCVIHWACLLYYVMSCLHMPHHVTPVMSCLCITHIVTHVMSHIYVMSYVCQHHTYVMSHMHVISYVCEYECHMSCHVTHILYNVICDNVISNVSYMSCHIICDNIISYVPHMSCHIMSYVTHACHIICVQVCVPHVMSCDTHVMQCHMRQCHIICATHVVSCHVIYHTYMSYHMCASMRDTCHVMWHTCHEMSYVTMSCHCHVTHLSSAVSGDNSANSAVLTCAYVSVLASESDSNTAHARPFNNVGTQSSFLHRPTHWRQHKLQTF